MEIHWFIQKVDILSLIHFLLPTIIGCKNRRGNVYVESDKKTLTTIKGGVISYFKKNETKNKRSFLRLKKMGRIIFSSNKVISVLDYVIVNKLTNFLCINENIIFVINSTFTDDKCAQMIGSMRFI